MKLRNKKTGEIGNLAPRGCEDERLWVWIDNKSKPEYRYNSLAELNEEWEDYEEPKEHWCITMYGGITRIKDDEEPIDDLIEIGNYFNSKEDAYDAWDKLKTWKRLKDKGFRFRNWYWDKNGMHGFINFSIKSANIDEKDIDLLFGGEE